MNTSASKPLPLPNDHLKPLSPMRLTSHSAVVIEYQAHAQEKQVPAEVAHQFLSVATVLVE